MIRARRLCMLVHGPYPLSEGRVVAEARAAADAGWEVDVVSAREPGEPAVETVDEIVVFRLPVRHTQGSGVVTTALEYLGFAALASARLMTLARRRRYHVVHVHNPPDLLVLATVVPRLLGARVVLDVHDLAPELFASRYAGKRGARMIEALLRTIERVALRTSHAVVTVHEPYRRALESRGVPVEKITVVLNSLDERLLPAEQPLAGNGLRVVYHGTITPHYGVELLVDAAGRILPEAPALTVEIYGDGDAVGAVRDRAHAVGIADRTYLSGRFLPHREVLERIRGASVGVVCNLPIARNADAAPTKLFEYAALGVPIVAADLPAIREHFSPQEVRFFSAGDAAALADALRDVATDPDAAEARAAAARRRYEEYRWSHSAARYVALLERLAPASP